MLNPFFKTFCILLSVLCFSFILCSQLFAEYRAYLLEVYDLIDEKKQEIKTGFSPDEYIETHGGRTRISVLKKASWMCYGDTSKYTPVCDMPSAKKPIFKIGDQVQINLEKHITDQWVGEVELMLYRFDLKSNIYGIRFFNKRNLYGRYFEFNLKSYETSK